MSQDILSDEFARDAYAIGKRAHDRAVADGLEVVTAGKKPGEYIVEKDGKRYKAQLTNGKFVIVSE